MYSAVGVEQLKLCWLLVAGAIKTPAWWAHSLASFSPTNHPAFLPFEKRRLGLAQVQRGRPERDSGILVKEIVDRAKCLMAETGEYKHTVTGNVSGSRTHSQSEQR